MKNIPQLICLLFIVLILSCSSNDDSNNTNDIIIGKWRPIEQYESNVQVDLETCQPYVYYEYGADNSVGGGFIVEDNMPDECGPPEFENGWKWQNQGNNQYRIYRNDDEGRIFTFYKEQENLVEEHPNGTTIIIYAPYE